MSTSVHLVRQSKKGFRLKGNAMALSRGLDVNALPYFMHVSNKRPEKSLQFQYGVKVLIRGNNWFQSPDLQGLS